MIKECSLCKLKKEFSEFWKHKKAKDGLYSHCKNCHRILALNTREKYREKYREKARINARKWRKINRKLYLSKSKEWRQKNKERIKEQRLRLNMKLRLEVLKHYGNKCNCCNLEDINFLSFDHINNDGHLWRKQKLGWLPRWIKKNNFPSDIQILCYNCNMGKAFHKGICPHKLPLDK